MTKKRSKDGPLTLGDLWGKATLLGSDDPKDLWNVGKNPWRGRRRRDHSKTEG